MADDDVRRLAQLAEDNPDSALVRAMLGLSGDLRDERRRARLYRLVSLCAALVFLFLWVRTDNAATKAQKAVDGVVAARTEARTAACAQDNIRIDQHNALADSLQTILDLINIPRPTATAEQQANADKFFTEARAAVDKSRVANRSCTAAALDAYYTTTTTASGG